MTEQLVHHVGEPETERPELPDIRQGGIDARQQVLSRVLVPHLQDEGEVVQPGRDAFDIPRVFAHGRGKIHPGVHDPVTVPDEADLRVAVERVALARQRIDGGNDDRVRGNLFQVPGDAEKERDVPESVHQAARRHRLPFEGVHAESFAHRHVLETDAGVVDARGEKNVVRASQCFLAVLVEIELHVDSGLRADVVQHLADRVPVFGLRFQIRSSTGRIFSSLNTRRYMSNA